MFSDNLKNRAVSWSAVIALAAALTAVSGCSDNADTATEEPAASNSATVGSKGEGNSETAAPPQETGDRSTPEGAVGMFITAIIEGDKKQACSVMGTPAKGSAPAKANTASMCEGNPREAQQVVDRLRPSFTPKSAKSHPTVVVAPLPVEGGRATAPGDKVTVNGQTLDEVMLSNSTGLKAGELSVEFEATDIGGTWSVTDMGLDVG